ncbi:hypothetical protein [Acinetobacter oleivorans]|nr:hypothetical protein [Acinetobacter oleivorans]
MPPCPTGDIHVTCHDSKLLVDTRWRHGCRLVAQHNMDVVSE